MVRLVEHAARTPVKIITVRLCQQVGIVEMENDGTGCVVVQLPPWFVPRKASKLGVGCVTLPGKSSEPVPSSPKDSRSYGLPSQWRRKAQQFRARIAVPLRACATSHSSRALGFCVNPATSLAKEIEVFGCYCT